VRHSTDSHEIEILKLELNKRSDASKNNFEKNIGQFSSKNYVDIMMNR